MIGNWTCLQHPLCRPICAEVVVERVEAEHDCGPMIWLGRIHRRIPVLGLAADQEGRVVRHVCIPIPSWWRGQEIQTDELRRQPRVYVVDFCGGDEVYQVWQLPAAAIPAEHWPDAEIKTPIPSDGEWR